MPRGEKSKYTDKQEHKADHIAEGYEKRGVGKKEAERRAWATVNKDDGGGKRPGGSGRGAHTGHPAAQEADASAARPLLRDQPPPARPRPRRRRQRASVAAIDPSSNEIFPCKNIPNRHSQSKSSRCLA